jgi:hypothetical protein
MQNLSRQALKGLAVTLSLIIYLAGLVYAGVRSYSLFAATIAPDLLPLAVLGIVALELTAVGLPLAIHYWTAPGAQRLAAMGFYVLDLGLIVGNSVLDAAHQSGTLLPGFMQGYGTYAVPALPVVCMVGWALLWALDPSSREHDMVASVRAATHEALMSQIAKAAEAVDITEAVELAAGEAARALVGETLGRAPRQAALPAYQYPPALVAGGGAEPWAGDQFVSAEEARQKGWGQHTAREISDDRAQGADTRAEQGQSHGTPELADADQLAIPTGKVTRKPARNGTRPEAADPKHPPRADGANAG